MKMCLTLSLVLLASIATAAEPSRPAISDVALQQDGVLRGQVLNTTGAPQAKMQVALVKNGKLFTTTETNAKGEFALANVTPGVYQIESQHAGGVYRVWHARTAPPAAKSGVLMIGDPGVVRAQLGGEKYGPAIRGAIAGGLLTGGLIAITDHNPAGS